MSRKSKADQSYPWIMVRLERTTHAALREFGRRKMDAGSLETAGRGNFGERDEPSLDAVIQELLRRDRSRADRVNRSKRRTRRVEGEEGGDE